MYSWRGDPSVPAFADDRPVLIFDGHCVLCSSFARFILRHDRERRFRLLAAQTPLGTALYRHLGLHPIDYEPTSCSRMAGPGSSRKARSAFSSASVSHGR
jgi:predicted DCC family thiol-disulfide oxidoreductase YuxK